MISDKKYTHLDTWALSIIADPVLKKPIPIDKIKITNGIYDARVYLRNTYGFNSWLHGQHEYEKWYLNGDGYKNNGASYKEEIAYDREVYEHFVIEGDVLDVGGGAGTLREFLSKNVRYISLDPFLNVFKSIPLAKMEAYTCLNKKINFICGVAEFLPFKENSFNWIHMRSMLDHVQLPDLALIEARRVLKKNGKILIGLYVEGGKTGRKNTSRLIKDLIKETLSFFGFTRWKDHHTWHPSFNNLNKMVTDNGFIIDDVFWQPHWNDQVVYIKATKSTK